MEAGWTCGHVFTFREFDACGAHSFFRITESIISIRWIDDIEIVFHAKIFPVEAKVRFVECLLQVRARDGWCEVVLGIKPDVVKCMSWEDFITKFKREFVLAIEV